jgi:hypothetical protein
MLDLFKHTPESLRGKKLWHHASLGSGALTPISHFHLNVTHGEYVYLQHDLTETAHWVEQNKLGEQVKGYC